jgi:hypothetical protein
LRLTIMDGYRITSWTWRILANGPTYDCGG